MGDSLDLVVTDLVLPHTTGCELADELQEAHPDLRVLYVSAYRDPVAAGFGLLHGFGFAGALLEAGLPQTDIPLALAAFNVGIELGQLLWVGLLLAALRVLRHNEILPLSVRPGLPPARVA